MELTAGNLRTLGIGFKTAFQGALKAATSMYPAVSTPVASSNLSEDYGWLGEVPNIREWIGDRQINNLKTFSYAIKNRDWEGTLAVDRNAILFDNLGIYATKIQALANAAGAAKDLLIWPMFNAGFATLCYDGQYFFDTDHPVLDANGVSQSVANTDGGSGTPWYLTAKNAVLKPIIIQTAKDFEFVNQDAPNSEGVFWQKRFVYGTDAIYNAGYGLWQTAWGSKQTLDAAHFQTALAGLQGMKGDYGRPLGNVEFDLWVPPSLRAAAASIVNVQNDAAGAGNPNYQAATLHVVPWLA